MTQPRKENRVCDVCRLLDGDHRLKVCSFCPACNAWICDADVSRLDRRARAMILKRLNGE